MTGPGKVPPGLMRAVGSEVLWGLALSMLVRNAGTGDWMLVFPLASGTVTMVIQPVDHGTGFDVSAN